MEIVFHHCNHQGPELLCLPAQSIHMVCKTAFLGLQVGAYVDTACKGADSLLVLTSDHLQNIISQLGEMEYKQFQEVKSALKKDIDAQHASQTASIKRRTELQMKHRVEARDQLQCNYVQQIEESHMMERQLTKMGTQWLLAMLQTTQVALLELFTQQKMGVDKLVEEYMYAALTQELNTSDLDAEFYSLQKQSKSITCMAEKEITLTLQAACTAEKGRIENEYHSDDTIPLEQILARHSLEVEQASCLVDDHLVCLFTA